MQTKKLDRSCKVGDTVHFCLRKDRDSINLVLRTGKIVFEYDANLKFLPNAKTFKIVDELTGLEHPITV